MCKRQKLRKNLIDHFSNHFKPSKLSKKCGDGARVSLSPKNRVQRNPQNEKKLKYLQYVKNQLLGISE